MTGRKGGITKERLATILTVAVLVAALGIGLGRKTGWRSLDLRAMAHKLKPVLPEPQDTVYAVLNAARAGDVKNYFANYTGAMETALRQSMAESGEAAFANYLVQSNADVKGVAVAEPQQISETEVKVRVETIYQDRNQVQTMYLEKGPGGWKISRTDADERVKTLIPYGTPVK
ncbi:MAG TPA: hypothetical protein VN841_00245 [Bryobacteraceae bacterium]|nr:hypothetical protein [Bryobacteraceae bacterium]